MYSKKLSVHNGIAKTAVVLMFLLSITLSGCSYKKTKSGHIVRSDWTFEVNRSFKSGCPDEGDDEDSQGRKKLFNCLAKDRDGMPIRRHCAAHPGCCSKTPCYRTLGCGMIIEANDADVMQMMQNGSIRFCGVTPFCFAHKPCGLLPQCGKPAEGSVQQNNAANTGGAQAVAPPSTALSGLAAPPSLATTLGATVGMPTSAGMMSPAMNPAMSPAMNPVGIASGLVAGTVQAGPMQAGSIQAGTVPIAGNAGVGQAGPRMSGSRIPGTLVSRGIVPGASALSSGGTVAAIGVTTPAGTMTPVGVRLPNGQVNNTLVLQSCMVSPQCSPARPCCSTPHCGGVVSVNFVTGNAVALASALQTQGGVHVMPGGATHPAMGLANQTLGQRPIGQMHPGQIHPGQMHSGQRSPMAMGQSQMHPLQMGQRQMGQGQMGQGQMSLAQMNPEQIEELAILLGIAVEDEDIVIEEEQVRRPDTRSNMTIPRFHPIPHKPVFQRSEGMPSQRAEMPSGQRSVAVNERSGLSEHDFEATLDRVYLEGVSAAMQEVERKLEAQRQAAETAMLQEKIIQQSENVRQQLEERTDRQVLAEQQREREQQLQARHLQQEQARRQQQALAASKPVQPARSTPQRLPAPASRQIQSAPPQTGTLANMHPNSINPSQLAENLTESLKSSVANSMHGVNEVFAPLLPTAQREGTPRESVQREAVQREYARGTLSQPPALLTAARPAVASSSGVPGRPPVSATPQTYGLQPDPEDSVIRQAEFSSVR